MVDTSKPGASLVAFSPAETPSGRSPVWIGSLESDVGVLLYDEDDASFVMARYVASDFASAALSAQPTLPQPTLSQPMRVPSLFAHSNDRALVNVSVVARSQTDFFVLVVGAAWVPCTSNGCERTPLPAPMFAAHFTDFGTAPSVQQTDPEDPSADAFASFNYSLVLDGAHTYLFHHANVFDFDFASGALRSTTTLPFSVANAASKHGVTTILTSDGHIGQTKTPMTGASWTLVPAPIPQLAPPVHPPGLGVFWDVPLLSTFDDPCASPLFVGFPPNLCTKDGVEMRCLGFFAVDATGNTVAYNDNEDPSTTNAPGPVAQFSIDGPGADPYAWVGAPIKTGNGFTVPTVWSWGDGFASPGLLRSAVTYAPIECVPR